MVSPAGAALLSAGAAPTSLKLGSLTGGLSLNSSLPALRFNGSVAIAPEGMVRSALAVSPVAERSVLKEAQPSAPAGTPLLGTLLKESPRFTQIAADIPDMPAGSAHSAGISIMDRILGRHSRFGAVPAKSRLAAIGSLDGSLPAAGGQFELQPAPLAGGVQTPQTPPPAPAETQEVFSPVTAAGQLLAGLVQAGLAAGSYYSAYAYLGHSGWLNYLGIPMFGVAGFLAVSALGFSMLAIRVALSRSGEIEEGRAPPMEAPYSFYNLNDIKKILFTSPRGTAPVYIPEHATRPLKFHQRLRGKMKGFFAYALQGFSHIRYVAMEAVSAVRSLLGLSRLVADMYRGNPEVKPFVAKHRKHMRLLQAINILQAVAGVGTSYIVGTLVDAAIGRNAGFAMLLAAGAIAIPLLNAYSNVVYNWTKNRLNGEVLRDFRIHLFEHVLKLPRSFFLKEKPSEVAVRISDDVNQVSAKNIDIPAVLPYYAAFALVSGAMMIITSWQTTLLMLVAVPLLGVLSSVYGNKAEKLNEAVMNRRARMVGSAQRSLSDIRDVRGFSAEDDEKELYAERADRFLGTALRKERLAAIYGQVMEQLYHFSFYIAVLLIGLFSFIYTGAPSVGQTMAMVGYAGYMQKALSGFIDLYTRYRETTGSAKKIFDYLKQRPAVEDAADAISPGELEGRITFKNVTVAQDGARPVLQDISFSVEPGQRVSIVGEAGDGKSAVLDLLLRLNDPDSGTVSFDGLDARKVKMRELRSRISILHDQGIWNGDRTIRENLLYGLGKEVSDDDILAAVQRTGAGSVLNKSLFPDGLDSRVAADDWRLGGARKRLLEVARALLAQPRLLLLDNAESGLSDTEARQLRGALAVLMAGRTTFTAENHIERAESADVILVLDKGRLIERGTHSELMALQGIYYRLWNSEAAKK